MHTRWLFAWFLLSIGGCVNWTPLGGAGHASAAGSQPPTPGVQGGATWTFLLPAEGIANPDGTVTALVEDPNGNPIGHLDFFTSRGAPAVGGGGQTLLPDAVLGVGGLENVNDPASPEVAGEIDIPASAMSAGASTTTRAGGLIFTVTVEGADVALLNGTPMFDAASLVVQIEVSIAG